MVYQVFKASLETPANRAKLLLGPLAETDYRVEMAYLVVLEIAEKMDIQVCKKSDRFYSL